MDFSTFRANRLLAALLATAAMSVPMAAQNLLEGAMDASKGSAAQVGWMLPEGSSAKLVGNNDQNNGICFRTELNLTSNGYKNGATCLYTEKNVKLGFEIFPEAGKVYGLKGHIWRRNGGEENVTYRFYFADNLLAVDPIAEQHFTFSGNNRCPDISSYNLRFAVTEQMRDKMYFIWEATDDNNWQRGGLLEDLNLECIGDAAAITFVTNCDKTVAPIWFLDGEEYTLTSSPSISNPGYIFDGWYTDETMTEAASFPFRTSTNATLYAKWREKGLAENGNYMDGWDGNGRGSEDLATDFGWEATPAITWHSTYNSANYWNGYRDNLESAEGQVRRLITCTTRSWISYPVKGLKADKIYRFRCNLAYMNHASGFTFIISDTRDESGRVAARNWTWANDWNKDRELVAKFLFEIDDPNATEYLCYRTDESSDRAVTWGFELVEIPDAHRVTFFDGETKLSSQYFENNEQYTVSRPADPEKEGLDFVGWFKDADFTEWFDFTQPVTDDTQIYAQFIDENAVGTLHDVAYTESTSVEKLVLVNAIVSGQTTLTLTARRPFVGGSKVQLADYNTRLILDGMHPSEFIDQYMANITVAGRALDPTVDRIDIWRGGVIIIPEGESQVPATIFNAENLTGDSQKLKQDVFYRGTLSDSDLGNANELMQFDNAIRSFHLTQGYQLVLANNPDGTGYSRVYIAAESDLDVNELPDELKFASFARVARWRWVSKKGISGNIPVARPSWYYDWNHGGDSKNADYEYALIHQHLGWPSWQELSVKPNVSHLSGLNEPDHTDQSNATVAQAIAQWHHMMKPGLRVGSPTPDSFNKDWLNKFMAAADSLNYRVDYVVYHMYWDSQTGQNLKDQIKNNSERFGGRPLWITEWNNGANWTNETWPDQSGEQRDADFNIVYQADGSVKTVGRPHTKANSDKMCDWLKSVLPALDESPYLERHAFYNWVQDARAIELGGRLTPAGKIFADYNAKLAYNPQREYVHTWKIAPPYLEVEIAPDCSTFDLCFYDHNGETGKYYTVERQLNGGDWTTYKTLILNTDYQPGQTIRITEPITADKMMYRVKAMSYKDTESIYSRIHGLSRDAAPAAPTVEAKAISATMIEVTWNAVSGARAYRVERTMANQPEAEPVVLFESTTDTKFVDEGLEPETAYTYRVTSLSTAATQNSATVNVSTLAIGKAATPDDFYAAAADQKATLTWISNYDTFYRIYRRTADAEEYALIAQDLTSDRYVDTDLTNGTTYTYKMQAYNTKGASDETAPLTVTPQADRHLFLAFDTDNGLKDQWGGFHATISDNATMIEGRAEGHLAVQLNKDDKSHITLPAGVVADLTDFTIATWIKIGANTGRIFDFGTGTGTFMIFQPTSTTQIRYKITCPAGTYDFYFTHEPINRDDWNHIVLTQEGSLMTLYINGETAATNVTAESQARVVTKADAKAAPVAPSAMGVTQTNYLGRSQWSSDPYTSHAYNDFTIFNRALNETEVNRLYNDLPLTTGLDAIGTDTSRLDIRTHMGSIVITTDADTTVDIYSIDGRLIRRVRATQGATTVNGLTPGFYIVAGVKLVL